MAENPTAGLIQEEEDENVDYDSDGNPIPPTTKKIIMPLPPIDHTEVTLLSLYVQYINTLINTFFGSKDDLMQYPDSVRANGEHLNFKL